MANFVEKVCSVAFREVRDTFTIIWKIEYRPENKIRYIASHPVSLYFQPQTIWFLSLFMNNNEMALYLNRDDDGPDVVVIDFELSLLALGDLPQCVRVCRNRKFLKKDQYCFDYFLRLDDGSVKCYPLWFPNNSLTVRCRIWQGENAIQPSYCFLSTVFVKDRFSTDWCIEDYKTEIQDYDFVISTGILGRIPCTLCLIIDPKTLCPTHVRILLSIEVQRFARLVCTISIQTTGDGMVHRVTADCPFNVWYKNDFAWDFPYHIEEDDHYLQRFLSNDDLNLRLEFEFWISLSDGSDISVFEPSDNNLKFPVSTGESSASDDCLINPESEVQDPTHGREDSTVGDSSLRQEDSTVGDSSLRQEDSTVGVSALRQKNSTVGDSASTHKDSAVGGSATGHKDSAIEDSTLGHKNSAASDSTLVNQDTAIGDYTLNQGDTERPLRLLRKRKLT